MASRFLVPYSSSRSWMQDPLYQLQREIDRVFEDVFSGGEQRRQRRRAVGLDDKRVANRSARQRRRAHQDADLPGVRAWTSTSREGDVLTIRGERKSESDRNEQNFHVWSAARALPAQHPAAVRA